MDIWNRCMLIEQVHSVEVFEIATGLDVKELITW